MAFSTNVCVFFALYILVSIYHVHKSSTPLEPCHKSSSPSGRNCIEPLLYHSIKNNDDDQIRHDASISSSSSSSSSSSKTERNKNPSLFLLELYIPSLITSSHKSSPQSSPPSRFKWTLVSTCSPSLSSPSPSPSSQGEHEGMLFHFNTDIKEGSSWTTKITGKTENTSNSTKSKLIRTECKVTIPDYSRIRKVHKKDMHLLKGKFVLKQILSTTDEARSSYNSNNRNSNITISSNNNNTDNGNDGNDEVEVSTGTNDDEKISNRKKNTNRKEVIIAETIFDLTRIIYKKPRKTKQNNNNNQQGGNQSQSSPHVPQYKYYRQPLVLRIVTDSQLYSVHSGPIRGDGYMMETTTAAVVFGANHKYHQRQQQQYYYRPIFYVDDVALRHSSQIELAPPPQQVSANSKSLASPSSATVETEAEQSSKPKPPVTLHIKISFITPLRHTIQNQLFTALSMAESTNILRPHELDEIRYLLSDEYMYRFIITQIIGLVHLCLDYLAFSNEVQFYVGRKKSNNMTGISLSSLYSRIICDVIILLYLLDGDGNTSWFVLFGIISGIGVNLWKLYQFLQPKIHWHWWKMKNKNENESNDSDSNDEHATASQLQLQLQPQRRRRVQYLFISFRDFSNMSTTEQLTIDYDTIARTYLSLILYPMIFGLALYGRQFYVYKSWYSWIISNLANAVYTFGFISLCPQLYINYRLKSVAHLPTKVFIYKIFNTFVDDVFAFLVEMPMKHKVMTLRDDVIFVIFLVQAYIYRVDKKRTNEFGYAYEKENEDEDKGEDKDKVEQREEVLVLVRGENQIQMEQQQQQQQQQQQHLNSQEQENFQDKNVNETIKTLKEEENEDYDTHLKTD